MMIVAVAVAAVQVYEMAEVNMLYQVESACWCIGGGSGSGSGKLRGQGWLFASMVADKGQSERLGAIKYPLVRRGAVAAKCVCVCVCVHCVQIGMYNAVGVNVPQVASVVGSADVLVCVCVCRWRMWRTLA